jgi:tight adherence protein B
MSARARRAAAVVVALMTFAAPSAWAVGSSTVQVTTVSGRSVEMLMSFDSTGVPSSSAEPTATVTIDGRELPAEVRPVTHEQVPQLAVLVMDASGSMAGSRLKTAKSAATTFIEALPPGVDVALVSFNDTSDVVSAPTADRAKVIAGVNGIRANGGTTLYDAIEKALPLAPKGSQTRIIVLSDGKDTASAATLEDVKVSAKADGVPIDVISLRPTPEELATLREVSGASGGQVRTASTADGLLTAFSSASESFGTQVSLIVDIPPDMNASGRPATTSLHLADAAFTASTRLPKNPSLEAVSATPSATAKAQETLPVKATPVSSQPPRALVPWLMALVVGGAVLAIWLLVMRVRQRTVARRRIDQVLSYQTSSGADRNSSAGGSAPSGALAQLDKVLVRGRGYRTTRNGLAAAGVGFSPAVWLLLRLGIVAVLIVALSVFFGSFLMGLVLGGAFGWLLTRIWLSSRAAKRRKEFTDELPDFLTLLASGLRAGLSFNSALDSAAVEGRGEVGRQIRRALSEVQLGAQLDKALMDCADRMDSDDLRWTVMAVGIQREVGGNLSTILDTSAATVRARQELAREVRTLTAEGKLSAYVLVALPLGVFAFLLVFRREYISVLWSTTFGLVMLGAVAVLILLGWLWMRVLVRVQV